MPETNSTAVLAEAEVKIFCLDKQDANVQPDIVSQLVSSSATAIAKYHRSLLFFGEKVQVFVMLRHQLLDLSFLSHLEVRVIPTVIDTSHSHPHNNNNTDVETTAEKNALKMPWYSVEGDSYYWNGRAVLMKRASVLRSAENSLNAWPELVFENGTALIPIEINLKQQMVENLTDFDLVDSNQQLSMAVSFLWKPATKISLLSRSATIKQSRELNQVVNTGFLKDRNSYLVQDLHKSMAKCAFLGNSDQMEHIPYSPSDVAPVRRTIKHLFRIRTPFKVKMSLSSLSSENRSNLMLHLDIHNITDENHLLIENVQISGTSGLSIESIAKLNGKSCDCETVLRPDEILSLVYRLNFNDTLSDNNSSTRPAVMDVNRYQTEIKEGLRDSKMKIFASMYSESEDGRRSEFVHVQTVLDLVVTSNGQLVFKSSNSEEQGVVPPGRIIPVEDQEGISISFTPLSTAHLHRIFTVKVLISNQTDKVHNLRLIFPNDQTAALEEAQPTIKPCETVHMEPIEFLEMYDQLHGQGSALVCLENNISINGLEPHSSTSVHLHFLPIRGAGTLQSIDLIRCIDEETARSADIVNALEMLIHAS